MYARRSHRRVFRRRGRGTGLPVSDSAAAGAGTGGAELAGARRIMRVASANANIVATPPVICVDSGKSRIVPGRSCAMSSAAVA